MELCHVSIGSETISSTPEHPYLIINASSDTPIVRFEGGESSSAGSWVAVKDLVAGMKVLLSNGKCDTISMVEVEQLDEAETTYNFEVETGLYFCNARYYDPEVGRFINMDDISYLDPESINGLNLFAYCGNNPVTHIVRAI